VRSAFFDGSVCGRRPLRQGISPGRDLHQGHPLGLEAGQIVGLVLHAAGDDDFGLGIIRRLGERGVQVNPVEIGQVRTFEVVGQVGGGVEDGAVVFLHGSLGVGEYDSMF